MKRFCTCLIALALVVVCAAFLLTEAQAATITASGSCGASGSTVTWRLDSEGVLTISGTGAMGTYSPSSYYGYAPWYSSYRTSIKKVVIENGVTSIGSYAFCDCTNLTSVSIANTVTSISSFAFYNCTSLTNITVPDSVTSIGNYAFSNCKSLQSMTIPFVGASSTQTASGTYQHPFGYIFGSSSYTGGTATIQHYYGSSTTATTYSTYYIPTSLKTVTVTGGNILHGAFSNCSNLTTINLPENLTEINDFAFAYCNSLTAITVPDSVTAIGKEAFLGCSKLAAVHTEDIAAWCTIDFEDSTANPLTFAKKLYLDGKQVTELTIPDGPTAIGRYAFYSCADITKATIPGSVTDIGDFAFSGCTALNEVTYCGTQENWDAIASGTDNEVLTDAQITYHSWVGGDCTTLQVCTICGNMGGEYQHLWLDATCTSLQQCFFCGTTTGDYAHTWVDATCIALQTCSDCGATTGNYAEHTYDDDADNTCNLCEHVRPLATADLTFFGSAGLSFQDYIGMQILMKNSVKTGYDKVYVEISQVTPDGVVTSTTEGMVYLQNYTMFEQQIVSWSMTEQVTMTLYAEIDGVLYRGASITASVKDLAMSKLATYQAQNDLARCKALVDMLNYGAAVQAAYNYNAENLPNADLGDYAELGTAEDPVIDATNDIIGISTIKVYVNNISLQDKVEFQFMVKTSALNGKTVEATLDEEDVAVTYTENGSFTIIRVAVAAAHMRDFYTFIIFDADGNAVTSFYRVSVEAYAKTQLSTDRASALIAMMKYGDAIAAIA